MVIKETRNFKITVYKVSGEPFHLKPTYCCIKHNYHRMDMDLIENIVSKR